MQTFDVRSVLSFVVRPLVLNGKALVQLTVHIYPLQALQEKTEYEDAVALFSRVKELEPDNKAAEQGVRQCRQKLKQQADKDRKIFANMFQKFAEQDYKVIIGLYL